MTFLDTFKAHFKEELEETGRKPPAQREINWLLSTADRIFHTEKKEEDLVSIEAELVQKLCSLAAKIIVREGRDENLVMLAVIFKYLSGYERS